MKKSRHYTKLLKSILGYFLLILLVNCGSSGSVNSNGPGDPVVDTSLDDNNDSAVVVEESTEQITYVAKVALDIGGDFTFSKKSNNGKRFRQNKISKGFLDTNILEVLVYTLDDILVGSAVLDSDSLKWIIELDNENNFKIKAKISDGNNGSMFFERLLKSGFKENENIAVNESTTKILLRLVQVAGDNGKTLNEFEDVLEKELEKAEKVVQLILAGDFLKNVEETIVSNKTDTEKAMILKSGLDELIVLLSLFNVIDDRLSKLENGSLGKEFEPSQEAQFMPGGDFDPEMLTKNIPEFLSDQIDVFVNKLVSADGIKITIVENIIVINNKDDVNLIEPDSIAIDASELDALKIKNEFPKVKLHGLEGLMLEIKADQSLSLLIETTNRSNPSLYRVLVNDESVLKSELITSSTSSYLKVTGLKDGLTTVTVIDEGNSNALLSFEINVLGTDVILKPILRSDQMSVVEDTPKSFNLKEIFINHDQNLTYSWVVLTKVNAKGVVEINENILIYTPKLNVIGLDSFGVKVNNGFLDSSPVVISVFIEPENDAPALSGKTVNIVEDAEVVTINLKNLVIDPDSGQPISYLITGKPFKGIANIVDGLLSYTPNANHNGQDKILIKANDGVSDSPVAEFLINISAINDSPLITSVASSVASEGATYKYAPIANDPDVGDSLTWVLVGPPGGMTIEASSGLITWVPTDGLKGLVTFILIVKDHSGLTGSQNISILVSDINNAPVITSTPTEIAFAGIAYNYLPTKTDLDIGDTHVWSLDANSLAKGMTINSSMGAISWIPASDGSITFLSPVLTLSDSGAEPKKAIQPWSISVLVPPKITSVVANDPDDGDLVFSNNDTISINFSPGTNKPSASTKVQLDALFSFSQPLGTNYTGVWSGDSTLIITLVDVSGGSPTIGNLKLTVKASANLKNTAETSKISVAVSEVMSGDWGRVPLSPSGLVAKAADRVNYLSWNSVSEAISYKVYWSTSPGVTTSDNVINVVKGSAYIHANIANGTEVYYIIAATNNAGESSSLNEVSAKPFSMPKFNKDWQGFYRTNTIAPFYNNKMFAVVQDRSGNVWFGTNGGISKFNGVTWTNYNSLTNGIENNIIHSIFSDKDGGIWFATNNGVTYFNGIIWKTYTVDDGLAHNWVYSVIKDNDGILWVGTYNGLSKFDGTSWTNYSTADGLINKQVNAIYLDKTGLLWFGTNGGASKFDGTSWTGYTTSNGLPSNTVNTINSDSTGAILFGTNSGLAKFDGSAWVTYTISDGLGSNTINSLCLDESGLIWAGTSGGLGKFDGSVWMNYTTSDGLAKNNVKAVISDNTGVIWAATNGGGASSFDGTSWTTYKSKTGLADNHINSLYADNSNSLWIGNHGGVSKFDGSSWTAYTTSDGLSSNNVYSIYSDNAGALWFGTSNGVSKLDGATWSTYDTGDGLVNDAVRVVFLDSSGSLVFGTNGGVSIFDGTTWLNYTTSDGLASNYITSGCVDSANTLWFGTTNGVNKFDGSTWSTYNTSDGLANNDVNTVYEDNDGNLWFGTSGGGVSKFDGFTWTTYNTGDGLATNFVYSVYEDDDGNFWFGTSYGLSKFDGTTWTTYNTSDGLSHFTVYEILSDDSGNLWFGTYGGLTKFRPHKIGENRFYIDWIDTNAQNGYDLNLYYDTDMAGYDGSSIVSGISETGTGNTYAWDYSSVPNGTYYIYLEMENGISSERVYLDQAIVVNLPAVPGNASAAPDDKKNTISWSNSTGAISYNIYWSTSAGVTISDNKVSNVSSPYIHKNLTNAVQIYYLIAAVNANGERYSAEVSAEPFSVPSFKLKVWDSITTGNTSLTLTNNNVNEVCQDNAGNYWFATSDGVSKFDGTNWTNYTTKNGLAHNDVYSVYHDGSGSLWFSTKGGVSKFDGVTWTTYSSTSSGLDSNYVNTIAADSSGALWICTNGVGISKFDGINWINYRTSDGLANNYVRSIYLDNTGDLWLGTRGGVSKYSSGSWTTYTTSDGLVDDWINSISSDNTGALWFGTNGGVSKFDGTTWTNFTTSDGLVDDTVNSISLNDSGNLIFGTDAGVSKYDGTTWTTYTTTDGLANDEVNTVYLDNSGDLMFGTNGGGASKFDGTNWTTFTTSGGLVFNIVSAIYSDDNDNMWFGTYAGLSKYDGTNWTTFTTNDGLGNNDIQCLHKDINGFIWAGTNGGGLSKYDGSAWSTFTTSDGLASNSVRSISSNSRGVLWVGTGYGVSKFNGSAWTTYRTSDGLIYNSTKSVFVNNDNEVWIGTFNGVSKYNGVEWSSYTTSNGLGNNNVYSICSDYNGSIWFSTFGGGLSKYDGSSWVTYKTVNGLAHNFVSSSYLDTFGIPWFGTWSGVNKYENDTLVKYRISDGLVNDYIFSVYSDKKGSKWFGTNSGVSKYTPKISGLNSFNIEWTDSNSLGAYGISLYYDIDKSGFDGTLIVSSIAETDIENKYIWDTTSIPSGTYYVYLVINNGTNTEKVYLDVPVVIELPVVPFGLYASSSDTENIISWSNTFGAKTYNIYWSTSPGVTTSDNVITNATSPFTHSGLTNGTQYYYAVSAVNSVGESNLSTEKSSIPSN
ncbi:MAG: hypothetical protein COA79_08775 [Planctomycetota bacterium]|nr:MAG: hypothetical protein COA79_08775 [Planctomycetota bacterium]